MPLLFILVGAFLLRVSNLGMESFWLDELYVMVEADPHQPLSQLFYFLKCCDPHPPLFYLLERMVFVAFGQSEVSARILPAIAGTVSVWAIYLLGREVHSKRLGLIAAALTAVNYFNIYYSREARDYIFVFLFAAFSLFYLFRLVKHLRAKDMWLYSLFALLTMYSDNFGVILIFSEFCAVLALICLAKEKKPRLLRFAGSAVIILLGYLPWISVFLSLGKIGSFWISPLRWDWPFVYFTSYFGRTAELGIIMLVLLAVGVTGAFIRRRSIFRNVTASPGGLAIILLGGTILLTYGIPFIRSLLVIPMLQERYTIVALPAILIALAYGFMLIPWNRIKYAGLAAFLILSLQRATGTYKMYTKPGKTQFREVTNFMASDTGRNQYPILNDRIAWQESYYISKFEYRGPLLDAPRAAMIDSIIKKVSPKYDVEGFWLMDAHAAGKAADFLDAANQARVDSFFVKEKERLFLDAWAEFYRRKDSRPND